MNGAAEGAPSGAVSGGALVQLRRAAVPHLVEGTGHGPLAVAERAEPEALAGVQVEGPDDAPGTAAVVTTQYEIGGHDGGSLATFAGLARLAGARGAGLAR